MVGVWGGRGPPPRRRRKNREICPQIAEFQSDFPENIGFLRRRRAKIGKSRPKQWDRAQDWAKIQAQARLRLAGFPGFPGSQAKYSTPGPPLCADIRPVIASLDIFVVYPRRL